MARIKSFAQTHPQITAWILLAIGMVAILLVSAKDVALLPTQRGVLVLSTIALAGLCVWIINWE